MRYTLEVHSGESTTGREERFQELLQEVMPEVRRRHARYTAEQVFETAVQLAAYRLSEEAMTVGA